MTQQFHFQVHSQENVKLLFKQHVHRSTQHHHSWEPNKVTNTNAHKQLRGYSNVVCPYNGRLFRNTKKWNTWCFWLFWNWNFFDFFFNLKGRQWETDTEAEIFHTMMLSPNVSNSQGWARPEPQTWSRSPIWVAGTHVLSHYHLMPSWRSSSQDWDPGHLNLDVGVPSGVLTAMLNVCSKEINYNSCYPMDLS